MEYFQIANRLYDFLSGLTFEIKKIHETKAKFNIENLLTDLLHISKQPFLIFY